MNNEEKLCSDFNIYGKSEDIITVAKKIVEKYVKTKTELHIQGETDDDGVCLAYDVKNYLPVLLTINKKQEEAINKAIEVLNDPWSFESGNEKVDNITYNKKREVVDILKRCQ